MAAGRRGTTLPLTLLLMVVISSAAEAALSSSAGDAGWSAVCRGTIGECGGEVEEFSVDSESNRRILATSSYISYQSLKKDTTPCSRRGASYYNCRPGAQANPYSRGCSAISKCKS